MARKGFMPEDIRAKMEELRAADIDATAQDALALLTVEANEAEKPGGGGQTVSDADRERHDVKPAKKAQPPAPPKKSTKSDGQGSRELVANNVRATMIKWVPRQAQNGGAYGFARFQHKNFAYVSFRAFNNPEHARAMSRIGNGAIIAMDVFKRDGKFVATNARILQEGQAWSDDGNGQRDGQEALPTETKPKQPERANDSQVDVILGTGRDPFYVPESDAARIASAVVAANKKAAESGGVLDVNGKKVRFSLGPGTVIMFDCAQCHSQHRLVWPTLRGLAQSSRVLLCPQCLRGDGQTRSETGQRQQISRKEPIPVKKISPVEEAREQARAILEEKGNTAAACLQAMITLVQAKVVGNEAEAKAKVEAILVEIKVEEEQRQVEEEQRRAEQEAAAARAQAIEEAATILRKSHSQTNMAKVLTVLSQAGLELAVIAEVEARVAEMEEEERQQAEKEAAAARKSRVVELAEVAVAAAQAEGVEDPENAITTAIAVSEIELDEKIEALTMANAMWNASQQSPAEPTEETGEAVEPAPASEALKQDQDGKKLTKTSLLDAFGATVQQYKQSRLAKAILDTFKDQPFEEVLKWVAFLAGQPPERVTDYLDFEYSTAKLNTMLTAFAKAAKAAKIEAVEPPGFAKYVPTLVETKVEVKTEDPAEANLAVETVEETQTA